jgi:hypothetical protein
MVDAEVETARWDETAGSWVVLGGNTQAELAPREEKPRNGI